MAIRPFQEKVAAATDGVFLRGEPAQKPDGHVMAAEPEDPFPPDQNSEDIPAAGFPHPSPEQPFSTIKPGINPL
jgi:hypothetical protein